MYQRKYTRIKQWMYLPDGRKVQRIKAVRSFGTVYFKHELHEISRNTQKLYENDNRNLFCIFLVSSCLSCVSC
jgi:hypothetical protein